MIKIIPPGQFKTIEWKNGKGQTVELAINDGGSLDAFDWRLSMAKVVENGFFSDFTGYQRHLILIEGDALTLQHDKARTHQLTDLLSFAAFDGANITHGILPGRSITDFNVITSTDKYQTRVSTYLQHTSVRIESGHLCFVYGVNSALLLTMDTQTSPQPVKVAKGHLLMLEDEDEAFTISGSEMIIVQLDKR
jgi:environmental stress-induced protein Ves